MHRHLEKYTWAAHSSESEAPPKGTYGTCTVDRNVVRAASGNVVAELGCGVRVLHHGIVDDLGLQIGARGQDVLDRKPRPVQPMNCIANGPGQVRCGFEREPDRDADSSWYVVAGTLDEEATLTDEEATLTGAAAVAYFAPKELVELDVSVWCH